MNSLREKREQAIRFSIGVKLTIAFLILALVPMTAIAYFNLTQSQEEVATFAEKNLVGLSHSVASEITQLLVENLRTSQTLAGEPLVIEYLSATPEERVELEPRVQQTLQNFADTHPDYDAPGLLDANGIVVASLNPNLVGADRSFRDYFITSIQGEPYVSDVSVGRATGRPGVFLTTPVLTPEGEIVGIDLVWLKGDAIWSIIDNTSVGQDGVAFVVDQDGVIVAHPNRDLLYHSLGTLSPEAIETISSTIRFGTAEGSESPLIPESLDLDDLAAQLAANEESGTYHYFSSFDNLRHAVGFTRLPEHRWTVVIDLPESEFLAPLQRLGMISWISVGVVGVFVLIVAIVLASGITRPITRLTNAAIAVENDQPFEPTDIQDVTAGRDEIAHLGRVFSAMVVALRRRVNELRTVYKIGQDITATLEVDETLQAILERVRDAVPYAAAEITLYDQRENRLLVTAWKGVEGYANTTGKSYELGKGFTGVIGQERRSLLVPDIQTADEYQHAIAVQLSDEKSIRALLGVPLLIRDRLVGTLELVSSRVGAFDENDQRLLETIAPQAAIAIEKAQQIREREQKLQDQIKQLRIEIDQAKRERQVKEITETDYFQDLATRAANMRRRPKSEG